jgi:hypothetical protein
MSPSYSTNASSLSPWALAAWTSFLSAALLEAMLFSFVDPGEIHWIGHSVLPSRQSVYTVAFFLFWMQGMLCASLTLWLARLVKS